MRQPLDSQNSHQKCLSFGYLINEDDLKDYQRQRQCQTPLWGPKCQHEKCIKQNFYFRSSQWTPVPSLEKRGEGGHFWKIL